ncbi:MAG: SDR family NAD(P)-dependent oxidoreductase, partial [Steroidobacteraceae bacterium]
GLGRLTAVELARRGLRVFASVRSRGKAESLLQLAKAADAEIDVVELDVRSPQSVLEAVEQVRARAGRIDILVNNAAVAKIGPLEFISEKDAVNVFDTNVLGAIRLMRAVLPLMRAQRRGRIVNVSSGSARTRSGARLLSLYGASKAALHCLTLDINKELAPLGIRAVLVEGGVGGDSKNNDDIMDCVSKLGAADSPYVVSERIAAAQMRMMKRMMTDGSTAARMIAEACTVPDPPLRFPPEAQRPLDWVDQLGDRDFLKLCALDDVEAVLKRNALAQSPWRVTQ